MRQDRQRTLIGQFDAGRYGATRDGSVVSYLGPDTRTLKPVKTSNGYLAVGLSVSNRRFGVLVHQAVWLQFNGPFGVGLELNHIDGDKTNNALTNLELCTREENLKHSYRIGIRQPVTGAKHPSVKLTEAEVIACRKAHKAGRSMCQLAKDYKVNYTTMREAVFGLTWKHVPMERP